MLNLLVSLLNDLYEELKSLAKADWCRAQVGRLWRQTPMTYIAGVLKTLSEHFWRKARVTERGESMPR